MKHSQSVSLSRQIWGHNKSNYAWIRKLIFYQVKLYAHAKYPSLHKYFIIVKDELASFRSYETAHVPQKHNQREDVFSKLVSMRASGVNHSFIHDTLEKSNIVISSLMVVVTDGTIYPSWSWITLIITYIKVGTILSDLSEDNLVKKIMCCTKEDCPPTR